MTPINDSDDWIEKLQHVTNQHTELYRKSLWGIGEEIRYYAVANKNRPQERDPTQFLFKEMGDRRGFVRFIYSNTYQ